MDNQAKKTKSVRRSKGLHLTIQGLATMLQNAHFKGFFTGKIYQGAGKKVCVPGLNCYSCPGAVGACPIGSLQSFLGGMKFRFPYYVVGILLFMGALLGRAVCGLLCPFGFMQDLIYMIPFVKKNRFKLDKYLRYLKYAVLLVLVIILPLCIPLTPTFCKFLCPSGTISGCLLALSNKMVRNSFTALFNWKVVVLLIIIVSGLIVWRPFCKYLCPLGAIYGCFNKVALYRMHVDADLCTHCHACEKACRMNIDPSQNPNSMECVRCGDCVRSCPTKALTAGFQSGKSTHKEKD